MGSPSQTPIQLNPYPDVPLSPLVPEVPATPPVPAPPVPGTNGQPKNAAVVLLIFI